MPEGPEVSPKDTENTAGGFSGVQKKDHKLSAFSQRHCPLIIVQKNSDVAEGECKCLACVCLCAHICMHVYDSF